MAEFDELTPEQNEEAEFGELAPEQNEEVEDYDLRADLDRGLRSSSHLGLDAGRNDRIAQAEFDIATRRASPLVGGELRGGIGGGFKESLHGVKETINVISGRESGLFSESLARSRGAEFSSGFSDPADNFTSRMIFNIGRGIPELAIMAATQFTGAGIGLGVAKALSLGAKGIKTTVGTFRNVGLFVNVGGRSYGNRYNELIRNGSSSEIAALGAGLHTFYAFAFERALGPERFYGAAIDKIVSRSAISKLSFEPLSGQRLLSKAKSFLYPSKGGFGRTMIRSPFEEILEETFTLGLDAGTDIAFTGKTDVTPQDFARTAEETFFVSLPSAVFGGILSSISRDSNRRQRQNLMDVEPDEDTIRRAFTIEGDPEPDIASGVQELDSLIGAMFTVMSNAGMDLQESEVILGRMRNVAINATAVSNDRKPQDLFNTLSLAFAQGDLDQGELRRVASEAHAEDDSSILFNWLTQQVPDFKDMVYDINQMAQAQGLVADNDNLANEVKQLVPRYTGDEVEDNETLSRVLNLGLGQFDVQESGITLLEPEFILNLPKPVFDLLATLRRGVVNIAATGTEALGKTGVARRMRFKVHDDGSVSLQDISEEAAEAEGQSRIPVEVEGEEVGSEKILADQLRRRALVLEQKLNAEGAADFRKSIEFQMRALGQIRTDREVSQEAREAEKAAKATETRAKKSRARFEKAFDAMRKLEAKQVESISDEALRDTYDLNDQQIALLKQIATGKRPTADLQLSILKAVAEEIIKQEGDLTPTQQSILLDTLIETTAISDDPQLLEIIDGMIDTIARGEQVEKDIVDAILRGQALAGIDVTTDQAAEASRGEREVVERFIEARILDEAAQQIEGPEQTDARSGETIDQATAQAEADLAERAKQDALADKAREAAERRRVEKEDRKQRIIRAAMSKDVDLTGGLFQETDAQERVEGDDTIITGSYSPDRRIAFFYQGAGPDSVMHEWVHHIIEQDLLAPAHMDILVLAFGVEGEWTVHAQERLVDSFMKYLANGTMPVTEDNQELVAAFERISAITKATLNKDEVLTNMPEETKAVLDTLFGQVPSGDVDSVLADALQSAMSMAQVNRDDELTEALYPQPPETETVKKATETVKKTREKVKQADETAADDDALFQARGNELTRLRQMTAEYAHNVTGMRAVVAQHAKGPDISLASKITEQVTRISNASSEIIDGMVSAIHDTLDLTDQQLTRVRAYADRMKILSERYQGVGQFPNADGYSNIINVMRGLSEAEQLKIDGLFQETRANGLSEEEVEVLTAQVSEAYRVPITFIGFQDPSGLGEFRDDSLGVDFNTMDEDTVEEAFLRMREGLSEEAPVPKRSGSEAGKEIKPLGDALFQEKPVSSSIEDIRHKKMIDPFAYLPQTEVIKNLQERYSLKRDDIWGKYKGQFVFPEEVEAEVDFYLHKGGKVVLIGYFRNLKAQASQVIGQDDSQAAAGTNNLSLKQINGMLIESLKTFPDVEAIYGHRITGGIIKRNAEGEAEVGRDVVFMVDKDKGVINVISEISPRGLFQTRKTPADRMFDKYGEPKNILDAGYILSDGRAVDLKRTKIGRGAIDHNPAAQNVGTNTRKMISNYGAIKLSPGWVIEGSFVTGSYIRIPSRNMSTEQRLTLFRFIRTVRDHNVYGNQPIEIEIGPPSTKPLSTEFRSFDPSEPIGAILRYVDKGDILPGSGLNAFFQQRKIIDRSFRLKVKELRTKETGDLVRRFADAADEVRLRTSIRERDERVTEDSWVAQWNPVDETWQVTTVTAPKGTTITLNKDRILIKAKDKWEASLIAVYLPHSPLQQINTKESGAIIMAGLAVPRNSAEWRDLVDTFGEDMLHMDDMGSIDLLAAKFLDDITTLPSKEGLPRTISLREGLFQTRSSAGALFAERIGDKRKQRLASNLDIKDKSKRMKALRQTLVAVSGPGDKDERKKRARASVGGELKNQTEKKLIDAIIRARPSGLNQGDLLNDVAIAKYGVPIDQIKDESKIADIVSIVRYASHRTSTAPSLNIPEEEGRIAGEIAKRLDLDGRSMATQAPAVGGFDNRNRLGNTVARTIKNAKQWRVSRGARSVMRNVTGMNYILDYIADGDDNHPIVRELWGRWGDSQVNWAKERDKTQVWYKSAVGRYGGMPNMAARDNVTDDIQLPVTQILAIYMITRGDVDSELAHRLFRSNPDLSTKDTDKGQVEDVNQFREIVKGSKKYVEANKDAMAFVNMADAGFKSLLGRMNKVRVKKKEDGGLGLPAIGVNAAGKIVIENYFPLILEGGLFVTEDQMSFIQDIVPFEIDPNLSPESRFKPRGTESTKKIRLDALSTFRAYMNQADVYIGKAEKISEMMNIVRDPKFVSAMQTKYGDRDILETLQTLILREQYATGRIKPLGEWEPFIRNIRTTTQAAILIGNVPSIWRQPLSLFNAMGEMPTITDMAQMAKVWTSGFLRLIGAVGGRIATGKFRTSELLLSGFEPWELAKKYHAPFTASQPDPEFADIEQQVGGLLGATAGGRTLATIAIGPQRIMDQLTKSSAWFAAFQAELEIQLHDGKTEPQAEKLAATFANDVVMKTQPSSLVNERNMLQTGPEWVRAMVPFTSQLMKNYQLFRRDIAAPMQRGFKRAGFTGAWQELNTVRGRSKPIRKLIMGFVVPPMALGLIARGRPPETWDEFLKDLLGYNLMMIPVAGPLIAAGMFYDTFRNRGDATPMYLDLASSLSQSLKTFAKTVKGEPGAGDDLVDTLLYTSRFAGLPTFIGRDVRDILDGYYSNQGVDLDKLGLIWRRAIWQQARDEAIKLGLK